MTRSRLALVMAAALAVPPQPASADPCAGRLCAGAGRGDITPPVTTPMWGYNARAAYSQPELWLAQHTRAVDTDLYQKGFYLRSEGIHTRLYARALVLRNAAGVTVALVQVDLGAMTGEMWRAVAQRIAPLGIRREHLLIAATHTHGGPGAIQQPPAHGLLVGDSYDPRVVKRTVDGIVRAIDQALRRLAPARVAVGRGTLLGASVNRSFSPHQANPCPDPAALEEVPCGEAQPDEPHAIDPFVTMVRADRIDGTPIGVFTVFAVHGTAFGPQTLFTADNQGVAERLVEAGIRARAAARGLEAADVVAAYANGTEGDVAPACAAYNDFACAEQTGEVQARQVLALYDALEGQLRDDLPLDSRLDVLYMTGEGGTSPVAVLGAGPDCPVGRPPLDRYPFNDPIPGQGRKCPFLILTGTGPQWFWIQGMRLGDFLFANVPGEMTVQMGRRLRKRVMANAPPDVREAVVVGLANDYMAYLTTPEEYDLQWYEGTFTLWGRLEGPYVAERFGRLADALFRGQPAPAFVEPPDTSFTQTENLSPATEALSLLAPPAAGTPLLQPPPEVRRGEVVTFGWLGGQPSAEVTPEEAFVITQRLGPAGWVDVFTDEGIEDVLRYERAGIEDRWTTAWDVPLDAPAGMYRFVVHGRAWARGVLEPYELASEPFTVLPSEGIVVDEAVAETNRVVVRASYPSPDPSINFRLRPRGPASGTATVTVTHADGSSHTATGAYDPAAGAYVVTVPASPSDAVSVAVGGVVDAYGNRNGAPFPSPGG